MLNSDVGVLREVALAPLPREPKTSYRQIAEEKGKKEEVFVVPEQYRSIIPPFRAVHAVTVVDLLLERLFSIIDKAPPPNPLVDMPEFAHNVEFSKCCILDIENSYTEELADSQSQDFQEVSQELFSYVPETPLSQQQEESKKNNLFLKTFLKRSAKKGNRTIVKKWDPIKNKHEFSVVEKKNDCVV